MSQDFFQNVYEVVKQIPIGRVTTYGAIARFLGTGRSARVVGWAMNGSHKLDEFIPAHRVVNAQGLLTGAIHFPTPTLMSELLEQEGAIIQEGRILNFTQLFWDPIELIP